MSIRQVCSFYEISKAILQRWLKNPWIKQTRDKPPNKIRDEVILKDFAQYLDDYMYEQAQRLGSSKSGIEATLKHLGISQKNTLEHPKAYLIKRAAYQNKLNSFTQQSYPIMYMEKGTSRLKPFTLTAMHQLASPVLITTTGKQKSGARSLMLSMKRCCLLLITLSKTSTAAYSITGANAHSFQA